MRTNVFSSHFYSLVNIKIIQLIISQRKLEDEAIPYLTCHKTPILAIYKLKKRIIFFVYIVIGKFKISVSDVKASFIQKFRSPYLHIYQIWPSQNR